MQYHKFDTAYRISNQFDPNVLYTERKLKAEEHKGGEQDQVQQSKTGNYQLRQKDTQGHSNLYYGTCQT